MKSVVTRWEPLAMALNSTPSRSMSLGRDHSIMFPSRCPTPQRENVKNTQARQTVWYWHKSRQSIHYHHSDTARGGSWANTRRPDRSREKEEVTQPAVCLRPVHQLHASVSCRPAGTRADQVRGWACGSLLSAEAEPPPPPHLRSDPRDAQWSLWELCLALSIAKCQSRLLPVQGDQLKVLCWLNHLRHHVLYDMVTLRFNIRCIMWLQFCKKLSPDQCFVSDLCRHYRRSN